MFASFRHRLFSSTASGNFTLQQAGKELSRTFGLKTQPPKRERSFYEFGSAFIESVKPQKFQAELLEIEVYNKAEKDPDFLGAGQPWNPTRYLRQVINEAGTLETPVQKKEDEKEAIVDEVSEANAAQAAKDEAFWEKKRKSGLLAASHKPVELIVTGKEIHFMNGFFLTRFISDGGKILPRFKTGLNAKQQRKLAREVRKARQLGIIPIMQKFLPGFESNLRNQALENPLAGMINIPKRRYVEETEETQRDREDQIKELARARTEIAAERAAPLKLTFGIEQVDSINGEQELIDLLRSLRQPVPQLYSPNRLRFRAVEGILAQMDNPSLRKFLEERKAEVSDCTRDEHFVFRAKQYLHEFEEHVFAESKTYNALRFDAQKMRLFSPLPPNEKRRDAA